MRLLLFGTGDYYERYKKWFESEEVLALLDNSVQKQGIKLDGYEILSPEKGVKLPYDAIVVLSFYVKEMKAQLKKLGVPVEKIFHFYDLHNLLKGRMQKKTVQYFGCAKAYLRDMQTEKKRILLLSQELTLGGPPLALLQAAEVLQRKHYNVIFASMIDGPLREILESKKIPVIIDNNLQVATMKEIPWIENFDLIVCNTINFHIFLMDRNTKIPVVWWLHDALFFYDGIRKENIERISGENLKIVSVGPVPEKAIKSYLPNISVERLLYGVSDVFRKVTDEMERKKFRFVTIGFLEDIKGQDILFQAVAMLPLQIRNSIEVFLIGHDLTLFAEQLKEKYNYLSEVQFIGKVDRNKLHEILDKTDVLVCPSRQDSMPTVVAEAMMHAVPCIVSDAIGTVEYIKNGQDGMIFHSENVVELKALMQGCVEHAEMLKTIGKNARKIYEKVFSMEAFETELIDVVEKII